MNLRPLIAATTLLVSSLFFSPVMAEEDPENSPTETIEIVIENDEMGNPIKLSGKKDESKPKKEEVASTEGLKLYAQFETNHGNFVVLLDADRAPNTVGNFVEYLNDQFYDGLIFHRVIDGFMIQGGGYNETMEEKATRIPVSIESKNGLGNSKGTVAMARTQDPNSATSQFFINTVDNGFLNYPAHDGYGYTVFGKVISGMDIIEKIEKVGTATMSGHENVPVEAVVIKKAYLVDSPN